MVSKGFLTSLTNMTISGKSDPPTIKLSLP